MTDSGILFHAKHAFMPNRLGYCGPDERGRIQQDLEAGKKSDELVRSLQGFEAAYPFLKLIARSTGREVFDYSVPEAYWIGNSLLGRVPAQEFYTFSHHEIKGRGRESVKSAFKALDGSAIPHHTFYVMSTYATSSVPDGPNLTNETSRKVAELIDNCRISWGRVRRVGEKELRVEVRPLRFEGGRMELTTPVLKRVRYNPEVKPFDRIGKGDVVSLHWGYACDVLTRRQTRNISRYTDSDLALVNRLLATKSVRRR